MINRVVNKRFPNLDTDNLVINSVQIDTSNASTSQALVFDGTKFAPGSVGGGATVSNTAPSSPSVGDFWFDSTDATTYVYYDSSWVAVGPAIPDQIGELIEAKGDLIVANTASTATRLGVGTNGYYLKANSSTATGLEWSSFNEITLNYPLLNAPRENWVVDGDGASGTVSIATNQGSAWYFTANATGNWTLNVTHISGITTINDLLANGDSITVAFAATQGSTAYYQTGFQIDGASVTPKWQGGSAPSAGNPNSIDVYVFTIIKTGTSTYTVLGSQTQFA